MLCQDLNLGMSMLDGKFDPFQQTGHPDSNEVNLESITFSVLTWLWLSWTFFIANRASLWAR